MPRSTSLHGLCLILAFILGGEIQFSSLSRAESRLLVKATKELPRHGEGSLLTLDNGRLLLVYTQWYHGTGNDHDPARLVEIHSDDGGKTWSPPQTVQENIGKMNVMSASLVKTTSGKILLLYIRIDSNRFANLWYKESTDLGASWSEPKQLSHGKQGLIFAVNSAAIRLKSGRILLAAYGSPSAWQKDEHFVSFSYYSDDEGQTWHRSDNQVDCPLRGAMEPEIEQLSDGRILMLIRTQTTRMYRSFSQDGGQTWSPAEKTDIVHPEAPMLLQRIPGEKAPLILIWNNAVVPGADHQGPRTPLTLGLSYDDGTTWGKLINIEDNSKGSYCYASMDFRDDTLHLVYYGPGGLRYRTIPLQQILNHDLKQKSATQE
ncbi:sialidase family protein [Gimesia chilikensis]|uniref:Sialidase n=1 Tax=Gimesia chilikensis TaxID=2605989 RepID=A0A517PK25_9PLAN|nr:sialidase family protein [Gimesia chilikensis]QDT19723.1 Sialidase precursor [Gimesia chilikensis]